jgi:hypothetical protein
LWESLIDAGGYLCGGNVGHFYLVWSGQFGNRFLVEDGQGFNRFLSRSNFLDGVLVNIKTPERFFGDWGGVEMNESLFPTASLMTCSMSSNAFSAALTTSFLLCIATAIDLVQPVRLAGFTTHLMKSVFDVGMSERGRVAL